METGNQTKQKRDTMKITIAGTGYVGLVVGACLADYGHQVTCADIDPERVELLKQGKAPYYEPGLEELLQKGIRQKRLRFSMDLDKATQGASLIFVTVGTPSRQDGSADLSAVFDAAENVGRAANGFGSRVLAIKSTVPVGTAGEVETLLARLGANNVSVVSNPEFLRESRAIRDFLHPDRVVIGTNDPYARDLLHALYAPFVSEDRILVMDRHSAEMAKYASNAFLATRISFVNEIAGLCQAVNADVESVRQAMGLDPRIGPGYLAPGIGYGGSCLPKDVRALLHSGEANDASMEIVEAVQRVNNQQPIRLLRRILDHFNGTLEGRRLAVWGLAFKPGTDDVRESPSITLMKLLAKAGATVTAHDPEANDTALCLLPDSVTLSDDRYETLRDAEALIVATDWDEFRSPDFARIRTLMRVPVIFDGRNMYDPGMMRRYGFSYHSVGRPSVELESPFGTETSQKSMVVG